MGLDLILLPIDETDVSDWAVASSMLTCKRDQALFDAIIKMERVKGTAIPKQFDSHCCRKDGVQGFGNTQINPYGEPIRALTAEELLTFKSLAQYRNKAAWGYLAASPPKQRIALFWR